MRRSTRLPLDKILKRIDRHGQDNALRQRIAALVLFHRRGWSAERIAQHFEWPLETVSAWLKAEFRDTQKETQEERP